MFCENFQVSQLLRIVYKATIIAFSLEIVNFHHNFISNFFLCSSNALLRESKMISVQSNKIARNPLPEISNDRKDRSIYSDRIFGRTRIGKKKKRSHIIVT